MELKLFVFGILSLLYSRTTGNRFAQEELGVSDRLRFTSGRNQYYECEVIDNRLVSNLKIGIYVYNHKSSIKYQINDTNYDVSTQKIEDFYFAHITVKNKLNKNVNQLIQLIAKEESSNIFIDETIVRVARTRKKLSLAPKFKNSSLTIIVLKDNVFVGSSIGILYIENLNVPVTFYLSTTVLKTLREFSVTADGRIILTKRLNATKKKQYGFPVLARYTESSLPSSINIQIIVKASVKTKKLTTDGTMRDLYTSFFNGRAAVTRPRRVHKMLAFSFSEISPSHTIIGSVRTGEKEFLYSIITGDEDKSFKINNKTGTISVANPIKIDYEVTKLYTLSITGTYRRQILLTAKVVLNVLDANDNSPRFSREKYSVSVEENAPIGKEILKLEASDKDSGNNGKISFAFSNSKDVPFVMNLDGTLSVGKSLDIISNSDTYYLYVKAMDWGWPVRRESEIMVKVNIGIVNSHKPVMKQLQCSIDIPTNYKNSPILKLDALDQDVFDKLEYRMKVKNQLFSLNLSSGELSMVGNIAGSTTEELQIFSYDGLHESGMTSLKITFKGKKPDVHCENNKQYFDLKGMIESRQTIPPTGKPVPTIQPVVPLKFLKTPPKLIRVSESSKINTIVGVFTALNPNLKSYGLVLYTIVKGNAESKFQIDLFNGTLFLRNQLDKETTSLYRLEIQASGITGEKEVRYSLEVKVDNVNDNPPIFKHKGQYKVIISEHKNIGYVLVKVNATDADSATKDRMLLYSLVSPSSIFAINQLTGELKLTSLLSEQPYKEYYVEIQASDQSPDHQLHGYAMVHITVSEFANNPPICLSDEQRIEVPTNTPAGVTIGRVFVYDVNEGKAGKLTYTIKNKDIYFDDYFSLSRKTGLIQLKKKFSQQDKGVVFKIEVAVRDNGSPSLTVICHVYKIVVDGFGVSQPTFIQKESPIKTSISYTSAPGASVTNLKAMLPGNETSQNIKYELVDGNGIGLFAIDKLLGTVYVSDNSFTSPFYWLTVQAYLNSNPSSYRNAHVLIRIQHEEQLQPFFNPSVYHVSLLRTEDSEKSVVQLYATDGNGKYNVEGLKYAIYAGNDKKFFFVDMNGQIKSKRVLDVGHHRLNVTVSSPFNNSLISYGYVVVNVKTEHSDAPKFEYNAFVEVKVYETTKNGFRPPYLFQTLAKNPNSEEILTYENLSSDEKFIVDKTTGVVNTKDPLVLGEASIVMVRATNAAKKSSEIIYTLLVQNRPTDETKLSFKKKSYVFDIKENVFGITVIDFSEEIIHSNKDYTVYYYILSGNDQQNFFFSPIDLDALISTSNLKVWTPLDYERQPVHKLEILAFDGWSYSRTVVIINVENMKDNSLETSQACFEVRVLENKKGINDLIIIQVTDPDKTLPDFKYSMVNDAKALSPFSVNNDGIVNVKPGVVFDREAQDEYVITVVGSFSQENATYCINVFIDDTNDHRPNFTQSIYKINVLDSTPVGSSIMAAYATDKDIGSNARLSYKFGKDNDYFGINVQSGIVFVKKSLGIFANRLITLDTYATDHGSPPLSGQTRIEVNVILDLQRLDFLQPSYSFEISENLPAKSLVSDVVKLNVSSVHYVIIGKENNNCFKNFWIDPFTGIILTANVLDSDEIRDCTFIVNGLQFKDIVTSAEIYVKVLDANDNSPIFMNSSYAGSVSESQNSNTRITETNGHPLVVMATDRDEGSNSEIVYSFVEKTIGIYFHIDGRTGEITTNIVLDCEKHPSKFEFHVKATDHGKPIALSSMVGIAINVINVNDRNPEFVDMQVLSISLPAYKGMIVHKLSAVDYDIIPQKLTYTLDDQSNIFDIKNESGEIFVKNPSLLKNQRMLMVQAIVSDAEFSSVVMAQITLSKYKEHKTFRFVPETLTASVVENEENKGAIKVVNPIGYQIGEILRFRILNPMLEFEIGEISGIISTLQGVKFDREKISIYLLHVEVWKFSSPQVVARTVVNITVEDKNDNHPVFLQKTFYKAIDIDNKVGTSLLSVMATDADTGLNARISYTIESGDGMEYFNCNPDSGVITLKKKFIKSQMKQKYTFVIKASDHGTNVLSDTSTVEIHLINKDQPMFSSNYLEKLPEDAQQGHSIVKINAIGRDNRQVYYQIVEGDEYEVFHVGFTNGELMVAGQLDFAKQNFYNMKIRAIDSLTGSWSDAICDITIEDVNNHYPIFEKSNYAVEVPENKIVGSQIGVVKALDKDANSNADITYTLTPLSDGSNGLFKVGRFSGIISLTASLDAELKTSHLLQVTATDDGKPYKSSYTHVNVVVTDVNDNEPKFLAPHYDFSFESYEKEAQFVGQVHAFDADLNDELTFSIKPRSKYFSVDSTSGTVYLKGDPSPTDVTKVKVIVSDGKNEVNVDVSVHWKGDNRHEPQLSNNMTASVNENAAPEITVVTKVLAQDGDKGKYGKIKYQIDSNDFQKYFTIDENGTIHTTGVVFDHEVSSGFVIPVRATDGGGLFAISNIKIAVQDQNDNTPTFEFSSYEANVMTSQISAESLVHAMAHDLDSGINAELKYVAHGLGSDSPLLVDNRTGLISLAGTPRGNKYQFSIRVSDNGYPVLQSRAEIQIFVKGWNHNILTFTNNTYVYDIKEDIKSDVLFKVQATMKDYIGDITYEFVEGNLPHTRSVGVFEMHSKDGGFGLAKRLDYETINVYKLTVKATSENGDTTNCFVIINVINVNDNSPAFEAPKTYLIKIAESITLARLLIQVRANDLDDPEGDRLKYSIISDTNAPFSINRHNGWIHTREHLDREKQGSYDLKIRVSDEDGYSDEATVKIILIDVNDSPPVFTKSEYILKIKEDTLVQQHIGMVTAEDKDLDSNVQYFFKTTDKCNHQFAIDHSTGAISLLRTISAGVYKFSIVAYDGWFLTPAKVTVRVTDVNDHQPVCISYYSVNIREDWDIAKEIVKIEAKDEDPSDILKHLVQGDGIGKFDINEKTGVLKAINYLDYETQSTHNFKVVVTDNGGHNCESDIFMELKDVNDNEPKFNQDLYIATVQENTSQSVVVTQVRATDRDTFNNRKVTYSILQNNFKNAFAIGTRGIVTVNDPSVLDRKRIANYSLVVEAKDSGEPSLSSTTKLQIIVLANSDTPPQFEKLGYVFNITENNDLNAIVGKIILHSTKNLKDKKINVTVINDASKGFTIDSTGTLKINKHLDYETQSRYSFNILACYEKIPSLSSTVNVEVQVNDQNDNRPLFSQEVFRKQIDENVRTGIFVLQTFATDRDGTTKNSAVTYSIEGEPNIPFVIGATGIIIVNGVIDHEIQSSYSFYVVAKDNGSPQFETKVQAIVNITDLNDNAPIISDYNASVIVQEGKKSGSELIKVTIRDVDSPKNGAPFHCMLLSGDETQFKVRTEDGNICVVSSKELFDRKKKNRYTLELRVTDSGTPTQFSNCEIKIVIVEESFHPPIIQDPKLFYVIVSQPYGVTKIGQVHIFDKDDNDLHQFKITDGNEKNFFSVQPMSGVIEGKPTEGSYHLTVGVTDGKFVDSGVFKVVVNEFNEILKIKSISLTIGGVDLKKFMKSKMVQFVTLLARLSGTLNEKVFIWSIQDLNNVIKRKRRDTAEKNVDVIRIAVATRKQQSLEYIEPSVMKGYIENSKTEFQTLDLYVSVAGTACVRTKCPEKQKCVVTHTPSDEIVSLHVPSGYMDYKKEEKCYCPDGTEGPVCHDTNPCSHDPCNIGERCVVTSTYFKCECIEPNKCDLTVDTVTLTGDSYVTYQLKKTFDELFNSLAIHFRTETKANDVLFYAFGKDYFILEIEQGGYIQARFDFGSGVGVLIIEGRKVNDGNWHYIQIERYGNYVSMILDENNSLRKEGRARGNSARININGHGIVFGAQLSNDGQPILGFKGCMKAPKLNKKLLPFSGTNDMVTSVDAHNVQSDCKDSGRCSPDKCPRFSDCVNTLSSFKCLCLPGHYGKSCESKLTCKDNPCKNRGRCTYERIRDFVSYKCTCRQGFTGGQCHIALGPCASKPCLNNGRCIAVNENSYTCKCLVGFTSSKCSVNENPCASNPCRNGGTCRNLYNDYRCDCPLGKYGKQCSAGEHCAFSPCANGGACTENTDGSTCMCVNGYYGERCQNDVDECLSSDTCKHNMCINTIGDYYCNCTTGGESKICLAGAVRAEKDAIPLLFLIAGGAGALIIIIIIIVIVCCCWRKRKRGYNQARHAPVDSRLKYPLDRYTLAHTHDDEYDALYPPNPPPRGETLPPAYYDDNDQASAAMYDPSMVTFSSGSSPSECVKVPLKFSPTRTSVEYISEEEDMKSLPGYHWDYSEVPEDMIIRKMSREGSRIRLAKTDQYYEEDEDDDLEYVEMPELPERPASRRSSLPGYAESEMEIPELPELPQQVRLSRQSLRSGNQSPPSTLPRGINPMSSSEFRNRYSLLSDENEQQDTSYLHDDIEGETMSELTRVTRPRVSAGRRYESESSNSDDDGYTETSFNSDDDGQPDPYDPENTRKLERDIQKLIKDLQRRTEED